MSNNELIEALRKEAKANPMADAVFHVFALRERARRSLTVSALYQEMKNQKFVFSRSEIVRLIKFLASVGVGTLEVNNKGKVLGLKDVRYTFQTIGKAAVDTKYDKLIQFVPRNKFKKLTSSGVQEFEYPATTTEVSTEVESSRHYGLKALFIAFMGMLSAWRHRSHKQQKVNEFNVESLDLSLTVNGRVIKIPVNTREIEKSYHTMSELRA